MYTGLIISLALSLALALILETGFFLFIGKRNKKDMLLLVLVNILTNPVVVLLCWLAAMYMNRHLPIVIITLEVLTVLVEAFFYKRFGQDFKRPLVFSVTSNAFSFSIGVLIQIL